MTIGDKVKGAVESVKDKVSGHKVRPNFARAVQLLPFCVAPAAAT